MSMLVYIALLLLTGVISLIDILRWAPKRRKAEIKDKPGFIELARFAFVLLLLYGVYEVFFSKLNISYYFPIILTVVTILTGIIYGLDKIFWAKKRDKAAKKPALIEFSHSFFPVFLIVLLIRSFIAQPYRVPTGSLEPTVLPNDFLLVTQYNYGLRLPITNTRIFKIDEPKRGEITVFHFPLDPSTDYVKRIVGLPGDHIVYKNKNLYVNGVKAKQTYVGPAIDYEDGEDIPVKLYEEDLMGVKHPILINPDKVDNTTYDFTVPPGMYFAMGDNRDGSYDSRSWGFVPEANLVGRAQFILLSYDNETKRLRWSRSGQALK
ncbi:MAG: lepB-2 [Gammaproteobacteria bacterium]|jgi:signal peptidase I|nr:lepB-2 [Gammaproteobacteria bacterium]